MSETAEERKSGIHEGMAEKKLRMTSAQIIVRKIKLKRQAVSLILADIQALEKELKPSKTRSKILKLHPTTINLNSP